MTEKKHTPGPWLIKRIDGCDNPPILTDNSGKSLPYEGEEGLANLALCRCAPELLEACETALHELRIRCGYKGDEAAYMELSAAIAEATGKAA